MLTRHLPGYEVRSLTGLGEGLDNVAYEVNGELVVRASKEADPAARSEAELLAVVTGLSTLPVPVFVDVEAGVLAYFKLPGLPLMEYPVAEPTRLASALGEFVGCLHRASVQEMEGSVGRDIEPLAAWRQGAERDYREIAEQLPAAARRAVEDFLGRTPPVEKRVVALCHNDLGAEHVLVDARANTVTGIIDWTDAAIADPAYDLALIYRDPGPEVFDLTLAHYDGGRFDAADRERAVFYARCSLLEDIAYGLSTPGARRYAGAWRTSSGPSRRALTQRRARDARPPWPAPSAQTTPRRVLGPSVPRGAEVAERGNRLPESRYGPAGYDQRIRVSTARFREAER